MLVSGVPTLTIVSSWSTASAFKFTSPSMLMAKAGGSIHCNCQPQAKNYDLTGRLMNFEYSFPGVTTFFLLYM